MYRRTMGAKEVLKRGVWWPLLLSACFNKTPQVDGATSTTVAERIPFDFAVPLPTVGPLAAGEGTIGVKASDCGACHQALYEEWRGSTHAAAMKDPQYYAELSKAGSPRWLCIGCHAPVQNQRRWLITGQTRLRANDNQVEPIERTPNPSFDPEMQREGVTCATCHVRVDNGETYVVAATVSKRAPHPVRANRAALRSICQRCHDPGEGRITPQFSCWFETAREAKAHNVREDCAHCHMPS
ncbi:MAG: multiheme c-type cytochrome, partial [Myxococcota bacterium]